MEIDDKNLRDALAFVLERLKSIELELRAPNCSRNVEDD